MTATFRNLRSSVTFTLVSAALSACATQPAMLNSDRIEQRYGSYGVTVLSQDSGVRRSNLHSIENAGPVCRTYAVVHYAEPVADEILPIHKSILSGASIGSTFQDHGWSIEKQTTHIGSIELQDPSHPLTALMGLDSPTALGSHSYSLLVSKGDVVHRYATIIETHHPDYLGIRELRAIYGHPDPLSPEESLRIYKLVLVDHWD
jgi:hypothetical protein